ncbi:tetratricopeptide repeat protein [Providencia vermicola]|uniref:tetratricopeptide repeat protein n=1 Tax=Providencia vermicola TaxID=333965 RepID=UPI00220A965B|nr:sel1 repeat family protein [Providencia stuartii]
MKLTLKKTIITLSLFILPFQIVAQPELTAEDKRLFSEVKLKAVKNDASAQYQLAQMYYSGLGVIQNLNSARLWADAAAKNGNPEGYTLLADINLLSDSYFTQEFVAARQFATKAVEQGSVRGKISLAESLINPIAGSTDYPQSIQLLEEVVELNNPDYFSAPLMLGIIYLDGKGVPMDEQKAQKWFDKADAMTYAGYAEWMAAFRFAEDNTGTVTLDQQKAKKLRGLACEKGRKAGNEMFCLGEQ